MALYLAEYTDIGSTSRGSVAIPLEPAYKTQVLDVSASSLQSEAFGSQTCVVTLLSDEDCLFAIGKEPDAINGRKLIAKTEKVISVVAGSGLKIAVTAANVESVSKMDNMDSLEGLVKLLASPDAAQKQFAVMQANVEKMNASAEELRKVSEENAAIRDQLIEATNSALSAKAAADNAANGVAAREAALAVSTKDSADKASADKAALDDRAKALDADEAALSDKQAALNKLGSDIADRAGNLDAREKDLIAREAAAAALQADYEARVAKFKALTA